MKSKKHVAYFPVEQSEQALLMRVREADLADRIDEVTEMVGQLAEARLTPADLDQAIQLWSESQRSEGLAARFDNLEGRLKDRLEKSLAEIEGRLSRRLAEGIPAAEPVATSAIVAAPEPPRASVNGELEIPKEANVAFRVGRDVIWGPSAAQFYVAVWRWLFERRYLTADNLPISSGKSRYAAASSPVHPTGKDFTRAELAIPGVWVEVNLSRSDIMRRAKKALADRGVAFDVVVGHAD